MKSSKLCCLRGLRFCGDVCATGPYSVEAFLRETVLVFTRDSI